MHLPCDPRPFFACLADSLSSPAYSPGPCTQTFHRTHYRPDNAHLYIVGDVDVDQAEDLIRKYFGHLESPTVPNAQKPVRHFMLEVLLGLGYGEGGILFNRRSQRQGCGRCLMLALVVYVYVCGILRNRR